MRKNLIFDVDGTIWNSTEVAAEGWNRAIRETIGDGPVITAQVLQREFGQTMDVVAEHLFPDVTDMEKRQQLMDKCCEYEHLYLERNTRDLAYPGVAEEMEKLAQSYDLYIVSNCQIGYIELVMSKTGIGPFIRDHECYGNTGTCKGETIRVLMERHGMRPEETVYIGDTMGDYEACAIAGIPFVFASYGFGEVKEAAYRIERFAQLEEAVGRM